MLSSPLFRAGDVLSLGDGAPDRYTVDHIRNDSITDCYVLSGYLFAGGFPCNIFSGGQRILHQLSATERTNLR